MVVVIVPELKLRSESLFYLMARLNNEPPELAAPGAFRLPRLEPLQLAELERLLFPPPVLKTTCDMDKLLSPRPAELLADEEDSPGLPPPRKLVLRFMTGRLDFNATDKLLVLGSDAPPKLLPPLRCLLKNGALCDSLDCENELLDPEEILRLRARPFFIFWSSNFIDSSSSIRRCWENSWLSANISSSRCIRARLAKRLLRRS